MPVQSLDDALWHELQDLLSAERQLTKALPKMAKAADNDELRQAFEDHLEETKGHAQRIEQAMELLGKTPKSKKCDAMEGLVEEGKHVIEEDAEPAVKDAMLIAAAQKVEHYEIASYGAVCTWADQLGQKDVATLLKQNMSEEKNADGLLTKIAGRVNRMAESGNGGNGGSRSRRRA